jgi:hypothetical protein
MPRTVFEVIRASDRDTLTTIYDSQFIRPMINEKVVISGAEYRVVDIIHRISNINANYRVEIIVDA